MHCTRKLCAAVELKGAWKDRGTAGGKRACAAQTRWCAAAEIREHRKNKGCCRRQTSMPCTKRGCAAATGNKAEKGVLHRPSVPHKRRMRRKRGGAAGEEQAVP
eukprot:scaffold59669_cov18-Tisochrysis_lutea.AAC.1